MFQDERLSKGGGRQRTDHVSLTSLYASDVADVVGHGEEECELVFRREMAPVWAGDDSHAAPMVDVGGGTLEFVLDGGEVEVPAVDFIAVQPKF